MSGWESDNLTGRVSGSYLVPYLRRYDSRRRFTWLKEGSRESWEICSLHAHDSRISRSLQLESSLDLIFANLGLILGSSRSLFNEIILHFYFRNRLDMFFDGFSGAWDDLRVCALRKIQRWPWTSRLGAHDGRGEQYVEEAGDTRPARRRLKVIQTAILQEA